MPKDLAMPPLPLTSVIATSSTEPNRLSPPMTETAWCHYQLLNQTMVYLKITDV
jgi:hypothetical protein